MKVQAGDLTKALGAVVWLIESRNVVPVLDCVLIEPHVDTLTVTAHNLDACATVTVPAEAELLEKPFAVPGAQLHGIVKSMSPGNAVTLTAAEERLTVSWRKSHYKLSTLPTDTFPPKLAAEGGVSFVLHKDGVARLLGEPAPFVAHDNRYYLAGIFMHPDRDQLVGVATDGRRIYRATHPTPELNGEWQNNGERAGIIIPPKIAAELVHWGIDIELRIADGIIEAKGFGAMNPTIVSKTIDATYPPYDRIIPSPGGHGFSCLRTELANVVARLSAVAPRIKDMTPGAGFVWDGGDTVSVVSGAALARYFSCHGNLRCKADTCG
jgi:DNA polymerase III subunit beta